MRKFYYKLDDIKTELAYLAGPEHTVFQDCHYFDGSLNWHGVDLQLMMDENDLWEYWICNYGNRRIGFTTDQIPRQSNNTEKMDAAIQVERLLRNFFLLNLEKYCGMVKALSIDYDPLASYDMHEVSGGSSKTAEVNSRPAKIETTLESTTYESETFRNAQKTTQDPTVDSSTKYKDATQTITWEDGDQTTDFTTPQGNTTSVAKSHKWGTTDRPAQEFIEKEFEVRRQNILKEFFEDLNTYVLLSTWD